VSEAPQPEFGLAPTAVSQPLATAKPTLFHGSAEIPAATAKMRLVQLADEIVSVLSSDPNASVRVVLEISAEFPNGVTDSVKRAVSENAKILELKGAEWE
jgi:hypothetical protein